MKIAIIGPGALGCLLAVSLKAGTDCEICILDHNPERAKHLTKQGILLVQDIGETKYPVFVSSDANKIGPVDLVLLCVKSHHIPDALATADPLFRSGNLTIAFQNGIGHLDFLLSAMHFPWAVGVTTLGATLLAPGKVRKGGNGPTRFGFFNQDYENQQNVLQKTTVLFNSCGLETTIVPDIRETIWDKFIVNIGINALTAIHNIPNGKILESEQLGDSMQQAVHEAMEVATAKGITFSSDPLQTTKNVCKATAANISSMLQDVRMKRLTEIDAINGALVQEARLLGIDTPANTFLITEIKRIEAEFPPAGHRETTNPQKKVID
ncbi:ketopantoate reductase family protein [Thermodesulfobacteriota bacterium]